MEQERELLVERINHDLRENARSTQNPEESERKEERLRTLYLKKEAELDKIKDVIQERKNKKGMLATFIKELQGMNGEQTEFREELWTGLLEEIEVQKGKGYRVIFRGGIEITI